MEGLELFAQDRERSLAHFVRATELDPDFIVPWLWVENLTRQPETIRTGAEGPGRHEAVVQYLLERRDRLSPYERYRLEFGRAAASRNPTEERRWGELVLELHPQDDAFRWAVANLSLLLNEPSRTLEAFADWEPIEWFEFGLPPGWWYSTTLTGAHHLLEQHDEELRHARRALGYYPDVVQVRGIEVRALAALGRVDDISRVIDDSLIVRSRAGTPDDVMRIAAEELRAHGYAAAGLAVAERAVEWLQNRPPAQARPADLAHALVLAQRWSEARALYGALSSERAEGGPSGATSVDVLGASGVLAAREGDTNEARAVALRIADLDRPEVFGRPAYWRAAIAAALGDNAAAVAAIREWIAKAGEVNYVTLHRDPNFESLREDPGFRDILRPRG